MHLLIKQKTKMKKGIIKWGIILLIGGLAIVGGIAFYMFNTPHRDIQTSKVDYTLDAQQLVQEYLTDANLANNKYLQEEGESKILAVRGTVASITDDMNKQKVVLLKEAKDNAGVSCTFTTKTNNHATKLNIGDLVTIKGVIRSGAGYDEDLEMYEDVIMEKCNTTQD